MARAEMLGMGMSQAGILLHASRFAEMLGMGMSLDQLWFGSEMEFAKG